MTLDSDILGPVAIYSRSEGERMERTRRELMPGVYLTCLRTDKFKTAVLSVHLLTALDRATASQNALLPGVLRRGTVASPDMAALAARLDGMYGAHIEPSVRKIGEIQAIGFAADFVDGACLPAGDDPLEGMTALMGELLLAPNTRGGLLLPRYVDGEREKLLQDIRARINDREAYANSRLIELMCPGETYGVDALGDEETARAVGYVALTRHYRALLAASPIEIFYCGSAPAERVAAALTDALATLPRGELAMDIGTDVRLNTVEEAPRSFTERMDVDQGKLVLGYRLGDAMEEPDMAALRVMNALLGGGGAAYVNSRLFVNVRERMSLCYYVHSALDPVKGLMTVSCGIDPANCEKTLAAIGRQVAAVKDGDFTDEELRTARTGVSADMLALTDEPEGLERFWLVQDLLGLDYGPEELAALAEDVTRVDVIKAAAGMECDAVYFLSGGEDEDESD